MHGALEVDTEVTRLQSGVPTPVVDLRALLDEPADKQDQSLGLWEILARKGFPGPGTSDFSTNLAGLQSASGIWDRTKRCTRP
jgi:hypothetical protein